MAITCSPLYPIPSEAVTLSISGATGNVAATQFELTSVPDNSGLPTGMLTDDAGDAAQEFTPDVPGAYGVTAYDYRRFSGVTSFYGDPSGEARDVLVATQTGTVYVGDVMDLPIRGAGHEVTLRLTVVNGTVRAAELVDPTTDKARYATLDANVLAVVVALEGVAATSVGDSLVSMAAIYVDPFNAHLANRSAHAAMEDATNTLPEVKVGSLAGAIAYWQKAWDELVGHLTTTPTGDGWHGRPDFVNVPVAPRSTDVAGCFVQVCDLLRCYTDHIAYGDPIHDTLDGTNTLPAPAGLTAAVQGVLAYFAAETPTAPSKANPGALRLIAKHGFATADS
ncbi:hypothetical protein WMF38_57380 [Sorangium sp. So ce118]